MKYLCNGHVFLLLLSKLYTPVISKVSLIFSYDTICVQTTPDTKFCDNNNERLFFSLAYPLTRGTDQLGNNK